MSLLTRLAALEALAAPACRGCAEPVFVLPGELGPGHCAACGRQIPTFRFTIRIGEMGRDPEGWEPVS